MLRLTDAASRAVADELHSRATGAWTLGERGAALSARAGPRDSSANVSARLGGDARRDREARERAGGAARPQADRLGNHAAYDSLQDWLSLSFPCARSTRRHRRGLSDTDFGHLRPTCFL